jgi:DivIVA domain-containing protein
VTWFFAVLIVLLMGAVAVVAAGRGGSMAEVYDDRPDSRVQAEGPLTAEDLRRVRFTTAFRGYRMSEVDGLLERLASELDAARTEATRIETARQEAARPAATQEEDVRDTATGQDADHEPGPGR